MLHNVKSKKVLAQELANEDYSRRPVSFYRYRSIADVPQLREHLYLAWYPLRVLGRVYVASEGINAQLSVPVPMWQSFKRSFELFPVLKNVFLNESMDEGQRAFLKLDIKVRAKILADGLKHQVLQSSSSGLHLPPKEFHQRLSDVNTVVVDTRNDYECETGHFEEALLPRAARFSDVLVELKERLQEHRDKNLLLYCTGGIRCEKASAFLKESGFANVYQLQGGIINYLRDMKKRGEVPKWKGSLFVFDGRMAEPTVGEKLGHCYQCGKEFDVHSDCANPKCHALMIQCEVCAQRYGFCCSIDCQQEKLAKLEPAQTVAGAHAQV